jgi:hypothetical protein
MPRPQLDLHQAPARFGPKRSRVMARDRTWLLFVLNWMLVGIGLVVIGYMVLSSAP